MTQQAVILAGGRGTRLAPYTITIPKPLLPVGERPILDIVLRQLRDAGFERVTIATGHLAELIEAYVGDGERYGLAVEYFREPDPLGTVGALAVIDELADPVLVMNGDVLTDLNYRALIADHRASGADATIAVQGRDVQISLGVLELDVGDRVTGYQEKPTLRYDVSMGVYCFSATALRRIAVGSATELPDFVQALVAAGRPVRAFRTDGYWLDIGRPEDYERAQADVASGRFPA